MVQQQVDSLAVYGWLLWWLLSQAQNEYFPFLATSSSTTYRVSQKKWLANAAEAQKNLTKIECYGAKTFQGHDLGLWERLILLSLSKKHLVVSLLLYEKYVFNIW